MYRENFDRFYPVTIPAVLTKPHSEETPRQSRFALILGRMRTLTAHLAERRQSARHRRYMKALSDHLLNDIGLERGDVAGADLGPLIKDPARMRF